MKRKPDLPETRPDTSLPANVPGDSSLDSVTRKYWQLQEDARIQARILEVSSRILGKINSSAYLEEAFSAIVEICQEAIGCDTTVIQLFDEQEQVLVGVAEYGRPYNPDGYFRLPVTESALSTLAFSERRTVAIDDVVNDRRVSQRVRRHFSARSGIAAPLLIDGKAIGVILTMTQGEIRHFTPRDSKLMDGLAAQAALAAHSQIQKRDRDQAEHRFRRLVELAPMAIMILDQSGTILQTNRACSDLTGRTEPALQGMAFPGLFLHPDVVGKALARMGLEREAGFEACLMNSHGERVHVSVTANLISVQGATVVQAFLKNITQNKLAEEALSREKEHAEDMARKMTHLASHDSLTGLVNRPEFERQLQALIDESSETGSGHVVCFIDLDLFKAVNDTGGHAAGDEMLCQVANMLQTKARKTDVLARLGGDEFGLLLNQCSIEKAEQVANMLRDGVAALRMPWEGNVFSVGASIGLAPVTRDTCDIKEVLRAVDSACFHAKEEGRNCVRVYRSDDRAASHSVDVQNGQRIRDAISTDGFCLMQQKILPVSAGREALPWSEALLRMDQQHTLAIPTAFLPTAERYRMMPEIDRWVIDASLRYLASVDRRELARLNINISGQSLDDHELCEFIRTGIDRYEVEPDRICFEITETAAASNFSHAVEFCHTLKHMGVRLALDDFGAGMSSFVYLKEFPVDYLKIDGHFVKHLAHSPIDREMVDAINRIGHSMGLVTIAEFIEDQETLDIAREIGVDYGQGYVFHRPARIPEHRS